MDVSSKDFIGLPIVVLSCDPTPAPEFQALGNINSEKTVQTLFPVAQHPGDVFADFTYSLWGRLTTATKSKLRDACFEFLRRTDEPASKSTSWRYEDDAELLD